MKIRITLNGTDTNPLEQLGVKHNPFPQLGRAEWMAGEAALNSLGGAPLAGPDDIRSRLKGAVSKELIEGLCARFVKGTTVVVVVSFPDDSFRRTT
jgi:hypothetical protein